jgi:HTH-type transcriptional regulator, sugar sensing transcriptional regulator
MNYKLLGLEPRDMQVYESLYGLQKGSLRAIAAATNNNRGTVYEIIKKLVDLGVVTFNQVGQRRYYQAAPPEVFRDLLAEQAAKIRQAEVAATDYVKKLRAQKIAPESAHFASFYEGYEGVAAILRDVLGTMRDADDKCYYVFSTPKVSEFLYVNFPNFSRQRVQENLFVKVIALGPPGEEPVMAERRNLSAPADMVQRGYTIIYGDKTALISLDEQNVPYAVVIDNPSLTNIQKLTFQNAWASL